MSLRIGIHTSISGSLEKAALQAVEWGANTFQIFSASPRMWRASMPRRDDVAAFQRARERFDLRPLVIHTNYLINLASLDPANRGLSVTAFRGELERADMIGAEYLVTHPGSYKGQPLDHSLAAFALGLAEAAQGLTPRVTVLLENTAGSGFHIGGRLEEIRMIRDLAARETDLKIGYCLDTCHLLAAGFDVASEAGFKKTVAEAERVLDLDNVRVIHANDSKAPLGSHVDRHENIGKGFIGEEGFRRILIHPRLRTKAFILETPAEEDGDGRRDIEMLKLLAKPGPGRGASRKRAS